MVFTDKGNHEENISEECYKNIISTTSDLNLLFYASCAFTCAFIFMATYYTNNNTNNNTLMTMRTTTTNNYHELSFDKKTLPMISFSEMFSTTYKEGLNQIQSSGLLFYWVTSPLFATGIIYLCKGSDVMSAETVVDESCPEGFNDMSFRYTLSISYLATLIMSLYLISVDIMTRKFVVVRGVDFFSLVNNAIMIDENQTQDEDNENVIEDLVLSVILGGFGNDILEDISCSRIAEKDGKLIRPIKRRKGGFSKGWVPSISHEFGNADIESEEVRRNNVMVNRVATSVLTGAVCGQVSFGHELLKFILLEALGGGQGPFLQDAVIPFGLSDRNYKYLSKFFNKADCSSGLLGLVAIVRGLCAYSGGIGEALCCISANHTPPSKAESLSTSDEYSAYYLPSCVCQSATHAIKASARFIILNMNNEKRQLNRLSLLIPVVLQSTYKLRCGTLDYVHYLYDKMQREDSGGGEAFGNFLTLKCPEMANIVTACDDCGSKIIQYMRKTDRSTSELNDIKVDENVKQWLDTFV